MSGRLPDSIKKKVLIIVENLPVPLDRRVWQEAQSLHNAGYSVSVLCPQMKGYTKRHEVLEGIHVFRHPMPKEARGISQYLIEYSSALFWEFVFTLYIFYKRGFGVIQACNPPDLIFLVALPYKLLARRRFIFDHHDGSPEIWVAKTGSKGGLFYRVLSLFEFLSFKSADSVMTVNEPYRRIVTTRGKVDPARVHVVRNSPKIPKRTDDRKSVEKDRNGKTIVGYLGVLGKQDGVEQLLDSLSHILKTKGRSDIVFKIMGTGPEFERIKQKAADLGVADNVIFTGWISGPDYVRHMESCDLCVNADIVNEYNNFCSPNKVYEYMFFSKPIVQFEMEENSYQAQGACVFARSNDYIDLGEQIVKLADDPLLRGKLGTAGKKRFHEVFSWDRSEEELLKTYRQVLEA